MRSPLTYDRQVDEGVPGGRGLKVDPASVDALLRPLDLLDVQLGGQHLDLGIKRGD